MQNSQSIANTTGLHTTTVQSFATHQEARADLKRASLLGYRCVLVRGTWQGRPSWLVKPAPQGKATVVAPRPAAAIVADLDPAPAAPKVTVDRSLEAFGRGSIRFLAEGLLSTKEVHEAQRLSGWHPSGYGTYNIRHGENVTTWESSACCD